MNIDSTEPPFFVFESESGGLIIKPVPGQIVADVHAVGTPEETMALARMFAAAPELLKAAVHVERLYSMDVPAFAELRAAIAKATGAA